MKPLNHILLIDDDATIRSIAAVVLKKFQVTLCESGSEALNFLKHTKQNLPDLIILDVNMPELDGKHTFKIIRTDTPASYTPIIFLTGHADLKDNTQLKLLGAIDVISKPFDPTTLTEKIESIWQEKCC